MKLKREIIPLIDPDLNKPLPFTPGMRRVFEEQLPVQVKLRCDPSMATLAALLAVNESNGVRMFRELLGDPAYDAMTQVARRPESPMSLCRIARALKISHPKATLLTAREYLWKSQVCAVQSGHGWVGTEHLALAFLTEHETRVGQLLAKYGITKQDAMRWLESFLAR